MKKFEFELSDLLYDKAMLPIRTKGDLLRLLAHTIKFLILHPVADPTKIAEDKKLVLYIDKMSRFVLLRQRQNIFVSLSVLCGCKPGRQFNIYYF